MSDVHIGHINLSETINGAGDHFVVLIESLSKRGVRQYVVVRNIELAKRLDIVSGVTVGPCVRSAVTAYCLMPSVDVVHVHDGSSWQAGLLLNLTKSIPFVLTERYNVAVKSNPINKAVRKRSSAMVHPDIADTAAHIEIYRNAADSLRIPTMML